MSEGELSVDGTVASGLGEGAAFTSLDWAARQFHERLGFLPHPGTLNLRMEGADRAKVRARLAAARGIPISPPEGYCGACCFPVVVADRIAGAAVLPHVPGYPDDKLEILAPVSLRTALGLADGDRVRVCISLDPARAACSPVFQKEES